MKSNLLLMLLLMLPASAGNAQDNIDHSTMDHSEHMRMAMSDSGSAANAHDILVDFELQSATGSAVTPESYRGKYFILGFGFTHCDFVCPTMVANMSNAIKSTEAPLSGVFISVDTERDTPLTTHSYAQAFNQRIDGLSGSYAQVSQAANNFRISFAVTKTAQSYTVQHGASIFLIDPNGELVDVFALNATAQEIGKAIHSHSKSSRGSG